jgi:outer membrane biosynthesis protein TonB
LTQRANWGRLAVFSLISTLVIAAVLWFVLDDSRWVAGVVLGLGLIEAAFLLLVMPRLSGQEETVPIQDGDWGVPPPSEPAEPAAPVDPLDD